MGQDFMVSLKPIADQKHRISELARTYLYFLELKYHIPKTMEQLNTQNKSDNNKNGWLYTY